MAINTSKFWKVYEQATDNSGQGAVIASFSSVKGGFDAAQREATRMATANPGTRYYVMSAEQGVYCDARGSIQTRDY